MTELVTEAQANALLWAVLLAGLIAGPIAALIARRRGGDALLAGLLVGGPPVLLFVMWRVYNTVTERLGLDTVVNLLVNLALFVIVGGLCGVAWAYLTVRRRTPETGGNEEPGEPLP